MGYSTRTLNNPERIIIFYFTQMMSKTDPIAIDVEIIRIDSSCSLEKRVH